jgi:hypothetical protein
MPVQFIGAFTFPNFILMTQDQLSGVTLPHVQWNTARS